MLLPSYQRQDDYFRKLTLQKLPQRSKEFAQFWLSIFSSLTLRSSMAFSNCAKGWRSSTTVSSFCTATSLLRVSSSTTRGRGRFSDSTFACRTRSPMGSIQTGTSLSTMPWPVTRSGTMLHQPRVFLKLSFAKLVGRRISNLLLRLLTWPYTQA